MLCKMNFFYAFIIALFFYLLSTCAIAAKISVWVHPAVVEPNETLTLTVSAEGAINDKPDFSVLEKDFQLLRHNNSSSVDMKRGSTLIKRNWMVTLLPRAMGKTIIPAIKIGHYTTTPLTIEVSKKPAIVHTRKERIFIEIEATPQQPYVNSQVLLAQRLYYAVPLDQAKLSEPIIKNNAAEIIPLRSRPAYTQEIGGRSYHVIERSYALFPKQSGEITIEPAEFRGLVPDEQRVKTFSTFNLYSRAQHAEHIISKPLTLAIKARAASFRGKDWLPAKNVTLFGKWSMPSGSEVKVGDSITLEVGVVSSGLRAASIPDFAFDVPDEIRFYVEKPTFDFTMAHSGLSGIRKQNITFMVTRPPVKDNVLHLPRLRLAWWNTLTDQQEEAVLAGITLKVSGSFSSVVSPNFPSNSASLSKKQTEFFAAYPWWLVLLSLVLLTFIFFSFYQHYRMRSKKTIQATLLTDMSTKQPYPHQSKQEHVLKKEGNTPHILLEIQVACEDANPMQAQQALQQWAAEVIGIKPAILSVIATINSDFSREIALLSQALYAKQEAQWQGQGLWLAVQHYHAEYQALTTVIVENDNVLQDLYPKEEGRNRGGFVS
ncbi:MAG TPA: hypothetical protein ENJ33_01425 [Thiothrix sp.]|nr:hypothetical protein [Thiothrix sp.]